MPDAAGRIPPVAYSIPTEQWERIFGPHKCDCIDPLDCPAPPRGEPGCRLADLWAEAESHPNPFT